MGHCLTSLAMSTPAPKATNESADGTIDGLKINDIGAQMFKLYYKEMGEEPDEMTARFYRDTSSIKRFGNPPVSGLKNIRRELARHPMRNVWKVRIWNTISTRLPGRRVSMQMRGEYMMKSGGSRYFVQTAVFVWFEYRSYYIHNDMIEWLDELEPKADKPEAAELPQLDLNNDEQAGKPIPLVVMVTPKKPSNDRQPEEKDQPEVEGAFNGNADDLPHDPRLDGLHHRKPTAQTIGDDQTDGRPKKTL